MVATNPAVLCAQGAEQHLAARPAGEDGHVLPATDAESDRWRLGTHAHVGAPQYGTGLVIARHELSIRLALENEPAMGTHHAAVGRTRQCNFPGLCLPGRIPRQPRAAAGALGDVVVEGVDPHRTVALHVIGPGIEALVVVVTGHLVRRDIGEPGVRAE